MTKETTYCDINMISLLPCTAAPYTRAPLPASRCFPSDAASCSDSETVRDEVMERMGRGEEWRGKGRGGGAVAIPHALSSPRHGGRQYPTPNIEKQLENVSVILADSARFAAPAFRPDFVRFAGNRI